MIFGRWPETMAAYMYVSGKLPPTPPPKPTLCPNWEVSVNAGLGEGWVGSFPETNNDPKFLLGQAEFLTGQNIGGKCWLIILV